MDNWLKNRLSPVKSETKRWIELSQSIQNFWETYYDGDLARLSSLMSIFTASIQDQLLILKDLGKYYDIDIPDDSIPIAVTQRRVELLQKDTLIPLASSLRRACPGIETNWLSLYALQTSLYGSDFFTSMDLLRLKIAASLFETSRGKLFINEDTIANSNPNSVKASIRNRLSIVKPLHIVFDGIIWGSTSDFDSPVGFSESSVAHSRKAIATRVGLKIDGTWRVGLLDHKKLDSMMDASAVESTKDYMFPKGNPLGFPLINGTLNIDGTWRVGSMNNITYYPDVS